MKTDYSSLYGNILSMAWRDMIEPEDTSANNVNKKIAVNDGAAGQNGLKLGLSMAIRKVAEDNRSNSKVHQSLMLLDKSVWAAKVSGDLTKLLVSIEKELKQILLTAVAAIAFDC